MKTLGYFHAVCSAATATLLLAGLSLGTAQARGLNPSNANSETLSTLSAEAEYEALRSEMNEENSKVLRVRMDDEDEDGDEGRDGKDKKCDLSKFERPRRDCVRIRRSQNFRQLSDRHAIFWESRRRVYLVTFATRCWDLDTAFAIRTFSRTGEICGGAGERVFVGRERCFVRSVERVSSPEHATCLVEDRADAREKRRRDRRKKRRDRKSDK